MRAIHGLVAVAMVAGAFVPTGAAMAELRVWTTARTEHVLRSAPPGNDLPVSVSAARNQWRSFQVLLRTDRPVKGVSLKAGELHGPQGTVLDVHHARLYRQHQLRLDVGTYRNDQFQPDWYPDPLIPFVHPMPGGELEHARFTAVPFDLPAGETHGFWVDLSVPEDALPGEYHGLYQVTAEGIAAVEVPVKLTVWDFSLPRVPTLVTALGSPAAQLRAYQRQRATGDNRPRAWVDVEAQCAQLLADHRINATPPDATISPVAQPDGSFQIPSARVQALREFVDRYHVNAVQVPHPAGVVKDPQQEQGKLRAWLTALDRAARELDRPQIVFYTYLKDEPNTLEDYRYVQHWGRAVREVKTVVKVLVVEQPWTAPGMGGADSAWGDLYGAVDIWCPLFSLHRPEPAARRQALGETIWTYTALCQGRPTPWWHIDFPLLNYRVPAWIAWSDRMKGLLYWGGMSYWEAVDDPWLVAPAYTGRGKIQQGEKGNIYQGEGSLVYPARAVGYDGIVPTVRLKALRDGIDDFEYLAIIERLGKRPAAEKIVHRLADSWFHWEKDPAAYDRARAELARTIMEATAKSPLPAKAALATPLAGHSAESPPWATKGLVRAIAEFLQTGKSPVDPAETIELFEFMTAAQLSKERGGEEVPLQGLHK